LKEKMHAIYKGLENYMMCFIVVDILMEWFILNYLFGGTYLIGWTIPTSLAGN
jgi:hypothetical protein